MLFNQLEANFASFTCPQHRALRAPATLLHSTEINQSINRAHAVFNLNDFDTNVRLVTTPANKMIRAAPRYMNPQRRSINPPAKRTQSLTSPQPNMSTSKLVSTAGELAQVLGSLNLSQTLPPHLFIDLEGVNLSRHGSISILTLYDRSHRTVYLIDMFALGSLAFTTSACAKYPERDLRDDSMEVDDFVAATGTKPHFITLKKILECGEIPKVFFDARNDSDALFALFGVKLQGVQDLQVMELASEFPRLRLAVVHGESESDVLTWRYSPQRPQPRARQRPGKVHSVRAHGLAQRGPTLAHPSHQGQRRGAVRPGQGR